MQKINYITLPALTRTAEYVALKAALQFELLTTYVFPGAANVVLLS